MSIVSKIELMFGTHCMNFLIHCPRGILSCWLEIWIHHCISVVLQLAWGPLPMLRSVIGARYTEMLNISTTFFRCTTWLLSIPGNLHWDLHIPLALKFPELTTFAPRSFKRIRLHEMYIIFMRFHFWIWMEPTMFHSFAVCWRPGLLFHMYNNRDGVVHSARHYISTGYNKMHMLMPYVMRWNPKCCNFLNMIVTVLKRCTSAWINLISHVMRNLTNIRFISTTSHHFRHFNITLNVCDETSMQPIFSSLTCLRRGFMWLDDK